MKLKFISIRKEYHFPVGALPLGALLKLRVETEGIDRLSLILTKDGEDSVEYNFSSGNDDDFTLNLEITTAGLYFYVLRAYSGASHTDYGRDAFQRATEGGTPFTQLVYKAFPGPKWLCGGIVYQIFPDRFAVGEPRLKTKEGMIYRDDWGGVPFYKPVDGVVKNNDMFGGNLRGITNKLDYLRSLGVSCIYLNPIFSAFSNHKYNTSDYLSLDSDFGTEEDFLCLTTEARKRGISVVLDGVFSHTGDDSVYFDKYNRYGGGAHSSRESDYYDWYRFTEYPDKYECWWGIDTLPNVDETNPSYKKFITERVVPKWLSLGARGFRLDVADELPDEFLDELFLSLYGKDALIIGEVWENAATKISYGHRRRYLQGGQLDSVINYPFRNAIISFIKEKNAETISSAVAEFINDYPPKALNLLFNVLSTHDTVRILNALSDSPTPATKEERADAELSDLKEAQKRLKLASGLQYTLPGVPCLYYGDEAGVIGYEDPFCRACFPWGKENKGLLNHYKKLGKLRRNAAFSSEVCSVVQASGGLFVFTRGEDDGALTIIANAGESVSLPQYKGLKDIFGGKPFSGVASRLGFFVLKK